jgi:anti-sigma factor RsiW
MEKNDSNRLELLSAYLDGEVTLQEKELVQKWLDEDPQVKKQYHRLLRLRYGFQHAPIPKTVPADRDLASLVFDKIDNRQRKKNVVFWTGGAIAATVVAGISTLLTGTQTPNFQMAQIKNQPASENLIVALNESIVKIPKAAVANNDITEEKWKSLDFNKINSTPGAR